MRLVNYGIGEICDRLTILNLKVLFGSERGIDTTHFTQERTVLLTKVHGRTLNGMWFDAVLELATVNAALWHAEDELRGYRADYLVPGIASEALFEDAAKCAFRIQSLNDERARLVHQINQNAGDPATQEKL